MRSSRSSPGPTNVMWRLSSTWRSTSFRIELQRRSHGEPAQTIELPEPPVGSLFSDAEILAAVAHWEAFSYAFMASTPRDRELREVGAIPLVSHLARVDGIPVRFDRLDSAAFLEELRDSPSVVDGCERPDGYEILVLDQAAELYARLASRGILEPRVALALADELGALATHCEGRVWPSPDALW